MKAAESMTEKTRVGWAWPFSSSLLRRNLLTVPLLLGTDVMAVILAMLAAYFGRRLVLPGLFPTLFSGKLLAESLTKLWWLPVVVVAMLAYEQLYRKRLPFWLEMERILKACTLAAFLSVALLYVTKTGNVTSRTLVVTTWLAILVLLPLFRYLAKRFLAWAGIWERPLLVLGGGKTARLLAKALDRERTLGYRMIGVLDDNKTLRGLKLPGSRHPLIPRLGTFAEAPDVIRRTGISDLLIAAPGLKPDKLVELVNRLQPFVNNIMVVPDLFGLSLNGIEAEYFLDEQLLLLNIRNRLKSSLNRSVKRAFDLVLSLMFLFIGLPAMALIALSIRLDSRGPALFSQTRLGQRGREFTCLKFRTMHMDSDRLLEKHLAQSPEAWEDWQKYNKLKGEDPRVTRVGAFLRRYSLDELPQLLNVFVGDMSLVGPRPYLPREKSQINSALFDIQVTKPGLTGLWQVSGRNNIDFAGRVKLDVWYVRNWSLWLDMVLLLRTVRAVVQREGAY